MDFILVAFLKNGKRISLAEKWDKEELLQLTRSQDLFCQVCNQKVRPKFGKKRIWHFAHLTEASCSLWESESEYHLNGKIQLYELIRHNRDAVELEFYLSRIKQRPDLLMKTNGQFYALEFQCSYVEKTRVLQRTRGFQSIGITPIWILGGNRFRKSNAYSFQLSSFDQIFIQSNGSQFYLTYYCPTSKLLMKATEILPFSSQIYFAQFEFHPYDSLSPYQVLTPPKLVNNSSHIEKWFEKKKQWRTTPRPYSYKNPLLRWFYTNGVNSCQFSSYAGVPVPSMMAIETPAMLWQSWIIQLFIKTAPLESIIDLDIVLQEFRKWKQKKFFQLRMTLSNKGSDYTTAVSDYFDALVDLGVLKKMNNRSYKKIKEIYSADTVEGALKEDDLIRDKWINRRVKLDC